MSDIWFGMSFRDKTFKKYKIVVYKCNEESHLFNIGVNIYNHDTFFGQFRIEIEEYWIRKYDDMNNPLNFINYKCKNLIENLLKDLLFKENLKDLRGKILSFDKLDDYINKVHQNEKGCLDIDRDPVIIAKENKIAREIILKELYPLQSKFGGPVDRDLLIKKCEYYENTLKQSIDTLKSRKFIKDYDGYSITYSGSMYIEEKLLTPFNDKIFLIAACRDEIVQLINKVFKPAVGELGYELKFQEKSEPKGSIHEDIWNYINNCKIVLCDLTFKRPNCFIEYGYALAKNKHIILCVEESEGKTKKGHMKVPFNTQNQKYSFWKKQWLSDNNEIELQKFKKEIYERVKMKLQIIDLEAVVLIILTNL